MDVLLVYLNGFPGDVPAMSGGTAAAPPPVDNLQRMEHWRGRRVVDRVRRARACGCLLRRPRTRGRTQFDPASRDASAGRGSGSAAAFDDDVVARLRRAKAAGRHEEERDCGDAGQQTVSHELPLFARAQAEIFARHSTRADVTATAVSASAEESRRTFPRSRTT